jgi:hypothetical protein
VLEEAARRDAVARSGYRGTVESGLLFVPAARSLAPREAEVEAKAIDVVL